MEELNLIRAGFTVNLLFDIAGATFFFPLVYVIIKYKKLHDIPCLKFVGLYMFCCLCSKFIIIFPYLIRVIPLLNVPTIVCISVQIFPMSFVSAMPSVNVGIALDRLLSVFFPIWYCKKRKFWYCLAFFIGMTFNSIYLAAYMIKHLLGHPFVQTNCTGQELFDPGDGSQDWSWNYNYTITLCYILIAIKFIWDGRAGMKKYFTRQPLFKSLAIVLAVQVLGWLVVAFIYRYILAILLHNMSENQIPLVYYGINCFSSTVTSMEFVALYFTSVEHRKALKKEFPRLFRHFPGDMPISVVSTNTTYAQAVAALNVKVVGIRRDSRRKYIAG